MSDKTEESVIIENTPSDLLRQKDNDPGKENGAKFVEIFLGEQNSNLLSFYKIP